MKQLGKYWCKWDARFKIVRWWQEAKVIAYTFIDIIEEIVEDLELNDEFESDGIYGKYN